MAKGRTGSVCGSESRRTARFDDRGSASIWVLSVTALVLLIGALTMTVTSVGVGRARAAAAADMAALAGAAHLSDGPACWWAREAAGRNSADLSDCQVGPMDITVSVRVPVRVPFWPVPAGASVRATARAGPAVSELRALPALSRLVVLHASGPGRLTAASGGRPGPSTERRRRWSCRASHGGPPPARRSRHQARNNPLPLSHRRNPQSIGLRLGTHLG